MVVEARLQSAAAVCIARPVPACLAEHWGASALSAVEYSAPMDWKEASDADLLRAIGEQEMVAFNTLYDRYSRLVFSTTYRVLNDAGAAEDVVQDIYVRLWQRPGRYVEERGRFIGWLLSVTRNRAIDEIRSRGRRPLSETQISGGDATSSIIAEAPSRTAARELESAEMVD